MKHFLFLMAVLVCGSAQAVVGVQPIEKVGYDEKPEFIVVMCYNGACFDNDTGQPVEPIAAAPGQKPKNGYYAVQTIEQVRKVVPDIDSYIPQGNK